MEVRLATIKKVLKGGDLIKVKSGFTRCDTLVNKRKEVSGNECASMGASDIG